MTPKAKNKCLPSHGFNFIGEWSRKILACGVMVGQGVEKSGGAKDEPARLTPSANKVTDGFCVWMEEFS